MADNNKDSESLSEEIFGFNFRSLKTLKDLIIRPNTVFKYFVSGQRGLYTPMVRLWIGLIGFQVILYYFWGGAAGILKEQILQNPENMAPLKESIGEERYGPFIDEWSRIIILLQPVIIGLFSALSVFILKPLNKNINFPARLNIAFGILTFGTIVGLTLNLFLAMGLTIIALFGPVLILLAYFVAFFRGAPGIYGDNVGDRVMNGLVFSIVLLILVLIGNFVMIILASIITAMRIT